MPGWFWKICGLISKSMVRQFAKKIAGEERQGRIADEHQRARIFFLGYLLLAGTFLSVSVYVGLFSSLMQIERVEIRGVQSLAVAGIEEKVFEFIDQKAWLVLSGRNYFIFSSDKLASQLQSDFKRIRHVEVIRRFPDRLEIAIEERRAVFVWCSRDSCYLVDEEGLPYQEADFESAEIRENNLIVVKNESGQAVEEGRQILSPESIDFLLNIGSGISEETGIGVKDTFSTPSPVSGDFLADSIEGWKIYLNQSLGVDKTVDMLKVVLEKNIRPEDRSKLEYIDLRTENKVYYRFRQQAEEKNEEGDLRESND